MLEGLRVQLVDGEGAVLSVVLPHLLAAQDFEVVGQAKPGVVGPLGLLETLDERVRERALAWARHVREVETGSPDGAGTAVSDRYDPARHSLAEREAAKAEELTAAGLPTSVATVRRMRARYRAQGVWGLVDQRATRGSSPLGRADERVVDTLWNVLQENTSRSTGTLSRLRRQVGWALEDRYGPGVVAVPPESTFNRLARAVAQGQGLLGTALQRRHRSSRPQPPFTPTVALRPGEVVMMDSTPLDVLAVLDDGVLGRLELTLAVDVATRSIVAAVLRPLGTSTVDAALLLAEMATPMAMRPGWAEALSMRASAIPYERLVSLDERLAGAAARPVIMPETIVVDQGRVFVSTSFVTACGSLGISVQPVPPANGPAKGGVERTFGSINTQFCQYVAGYTGSNVTQRGSHTQEEACWSLAQLQDLLDEWVVAGWQHRPHEGLRHPWMPKRALTPNQMWQALIGVCGYVPVPFSMNDYIELMPVRWQAITDHGIRFDHRTYDGAALNDYRGQRSPHPGQDGKWEVHHNPYDPARIWVRLPDGFVDVAWIHATQVTLPFTDFTWNHIRKTVARTGDRDEHEVALARALDALLRRASAGQGSSRERTLAARAAAAVPLPRLPAPAAGQDVLATLAPAAHLADAAEVLDEEADWPDEDDDLLTALDEEEPADDTAAAARPRGASIINDLRKGPDQWLQ
ncbi:Mu transposase C-terminal domain-containing protein [Actinacidiphila glaucinigra]|uniref:Mu transposase C-terminal domain-containing protein n=1 Tax=Actinacidiphila glaucinigra TaxID=235986 RepID=UPI00371F871D